MAWTQPAGDDAALLAAIDAISDPQTMLECMIHNSDMIGTDPYYRHINNAIWRAAKRIAETTTPAGYVITANDSVEAICLGTEADAERACLRLQAEDAEKWVKTWGADLASRKHRPPVYWAARGRRIL